MDIEKLIERLKAKDFERDYDCTPFECGVFGLIDDSATALSTSQAENEKLRAELNDLKARWEKYQPREHWDTLNELCKNLHDELEQVKRERDAAVNAIRTWRFCEGCKFGSTPMNYACLGCYRASKWVWNGQKEDEHV